MQVLLLKDVRRLGHVGDIVDVKTAYARNFLLPQRMAAAPTAENIKAIESEKTRAAEERARKLREYADALARMTDVSVTIEAAANPEGTLYGSVGQREIAAALNAQGHAVLAEHVELDAPIRTLDNVMVTIRFTDELSAQVKVWVVREGGHVESPEPDTDVEETADES
ncbi:MAG: 50S ribosomal protein L9 [Phycisphaerae bacterium]|nr:50S ribosomal protein L9 [Phycisphaerae bacterium]